MTVPFASLSIHKFITSIGAEVGFASIIAVAILVLLYFAHARETATLRDRLDEAQQRISGLEARIAQLMQAQAAGARRVPGPAPAPVVPAPAPVRPGAAPMGAVRRAPSPATAAAAATSPAPAAVPRRAPAGATGAPAGMAAPALASATKVIPDPAGSGDPDNTMFVPASAVAANGQAAAARAQAVSGATQAMPVAATATATAAAAARTPSASPRGAVAAPPRMQIAAETAGAATAAGTTGASTRSNHVRRIGGNRRQPSAPVLPSFSDEASSGGRFAGRVLPLLIGGVAVVVIIAGLIVITSAGGGSNGGQVARNTAQTGAGLHQQQTTQVPFSAAHETVAVLNGTAQSGLAGDVANRLGADGFRKGNITNAASQTQGLTFVYYRPGRGAKSNRVAAQHVARALSLSASRVRRAGPGVLQSCAVSASGASLGSCAANVIVSVGQDRVNLAGGGTSG